MALPVIDRIVVDPTTVRECEMATITIEAHDPTPASREIPLHLQVSNGTVTPETVVIRLAGGSGPLTYTLTLDPGEPGQVLATDRPNVFTYVAPCPNDPNHNPATHETLPVPHTH